jgi:hypothetical protein
MKSSGLLVLANFNTISGTGGSPRSLASFIQLALCSASRASIRTPSSSNTHPNHSVLRRLSL